jgi:catechol 2,3-dioxygenase-like lactoylglutathione lyase family enzyme
MPNFKSSTPCFPVADVAATVDWYQSELGFSGDLFPPNGPFVFAILTRDRVEIMLQLIEGYQKPALYDSRSGGVWDAYLRIEGITELFGAVKDRVAIKKPLRIQPYGNWEFEVVDPNGYVLVFSEER